VSYYSATPDAYEVIQQCPAASTPSCSYKSTTTTSSSHHSMRTEDGVNTGWKRCLQSFWRGEESYCNTRMKLIPNVVESNWMVKMAVGQRPVILGTKLQQSYHHGKQYFEIDIDLSSSAMATQVLGMVRGYSKDMVVDLGITIEGQAKDELPEEILCQTRYHHVDLEQAVTVARE